LPRKSSKISQDFIKNEHGDEIRSGTKLGPPTIYNYLLIVIVFIRSTSTTTTDGKSTLLASKHAVIEEIETNLYKISKTLLYTPIAIGESNP